jgi:hypothetical protein
MKPFLDKIASLTPIARRIVCEKATESPHTSVYNTTTSQFCVLSYPAKRDETSMIL